ncbi:MAG: L-threonylcarbamoyladenylate synthase [Acidimicrobiales bacterium]
MAAGPPVTTDVGRAVEVLRDGGLVGLPTETVYGLAADAERSEAIARVFAAKGRPTDHPLIVHIASADDLDRWATAPPSARILTDLWWPGPLTLLLRRSERVLDAVTGGRDTVAVRSPAHPVAQAVLDGFGGGLVAPSANRFGRVSPTSAADVVADLGSAVDLVLDGGPCSVGVESTIVDLAHGQPVVLRRGGVLAADLSDGLGVAVGHVGDDAESVAPGMLASHYAPDAAVVVLDAAATDAQVRTAVAEAGREGRPVGLLAPRRVPDLAPSVVELDPPADVEAYARSLYRCLRQADLSGIDTLVVVPPPSEGIGAAVLDRLVRAARR